MAPSANDSMLPPLLPGELKFADEERPRCRVCDSADGERDECCNGYGESGARHEVHLATLPCGPHRFAPSALGGLSGDQGASRGRRRGA